jgi:hypothetical protein
VAFNVKAGKAVLPGSGTLSVTGVGFNPSVVILITAGSQAEDVWDTSAPVWGGMAIYTRKTVGGDVTNAVSEFWGTDIRSSSFWSNSGVIWLKTSHGGGTPAFYIDNTHGDGFTIAYSGGFAGGGGEIVYYLCFGTDLSVGHVYSYRDAVMPVTLGWQPGIFFTLAHGGLDVSTGDIAFLDRSMPSFGFGGFDNLNLVDNTAAEWLSHGLAHSTSVEQVRYWLDGNGDQWVFTDPIVAQSISNSVFAFGRSPTEFSMQYFDGFPQGDNIRGGAHILEEGIYSGGSVSPNPIGVPLEVDCSFIPDAVVFLGPQDHSEPDLGIVPWGGRCIGFLTEDFQCCIAWGGYQTLGGVASFSSSTRSWVSNFTSTQLSDPTNPNLGTAEIGGPGFIMHTEALPKMNKYVRYAAYGSEEEAPGFFRVVGR